MTTAAILTVSDTRNLDNDKSGQTIATALGTAEITVTQRLVVPDDIVAIQSAFLQLELTEPDMIITNGGTGIAQRDVTFDALEPLLPVTIPGFGEHFRQISFTEIGTRALASRALAGFNVRDQLCFVLPGSTNACQTALQQLILPEWQHLLFERRK
ncbi:MogA/MoaB family molybdenum cofactor biosynthesis protein [Loigolactobacillus coryniformis]|uniref:Molybdenum cofactor biosynthesis protein B n=1 Tax=Loigolactobacillus coryniformis subsp. coryniformis KCTC 3167 = DSM 20001 TaxID=913848 RepID=A0A0R1FID8_9LACO|nr:MogA/MoaB family molybdenum cofactor biosynthesis protein [Loigolactobacillus coryniformis]ATO54292.1 molybdenum cofactor biosynthesis protein [Loigolactobacillus coryniformis subsp. coryniformis KCTC 3167 = DSM 20001]KRK18962.1 molybdopterin biosynthesis protein MoaB [Loigolactobacillus coryniformis subsp. coryniformis KCTC 3167 = DSM 20001]OEH90269.1 molybdenum cofactor biosynthesis protein B [Loigolactobacillus coryniformis subsp. coryniformis]